MAKGRSPVQMLHPIMGYGMIRLAVATNVTLTMINCLAEYYDVSSYCRADLASPVALRNWYSTNPPGTTGSAG